jgi:hypothetical protein
MIIRDASHPRPIAHQVLGDLGIVSPQSALPGISTAEAVLDIVTWMREIP